MIQKRQRTLYNSLQVWWLVRRVTYPVSTKIRHIGDKVLGGDLVPPG